MTANHDSLKIPAYRLIMLSGAVAAIALVGLFGPMPKGSRIITRTGDLLHLPGFAVITCMSIFLVDRFVGKSTKARFLTTLAVVFFSGCVEIVQELTGRTASLGDFIANATGAFFVFLIFFSHGKSWATKWSIRGTASVVMLYVMSGLVMSIIDIYLLESYPANLATFSRNSELDRWYFGSVDVSLVANDRNHEDDPPKQLKAVFHPGDFPALQLQHITRDWTPYEAIAFEVSRPTEPATSTVKPLSIRLHIADRVRIQGKDASYVDTIELMPGESKTIQVPINEIEKGSAGRTLNMRKVRFVEFMATDLDKPVTMHLANIRLVEK